MTAGTSTAPARDESAGYRSPLLELPGAVATDSEIAGPPDHTAALDLGVAAHYGDPLREQRNLVDGAGFVDLSHRAVVRISGDDRLKWLNDLTTQRLDVLKPGVGSEALILSPQGHVEHHLQLVDDGEAVWAHVEPDSAKALIDFLTSMRFMLRVDVADVTADWAVVWEPAREPHPTLVSRVDPQDDQVSGRQVFVPRADLAVFAASADRSGPPAGVLALEALRVAAGRARFGLDTDHRTIPHEMGWIGSAVKLDKGCYRGQETVARVANLGRPPRRLVRLHLDGSVREQLPALGSDVVVDDAVIGRLTSAAYHYELGPIALGVIKYATPDDVPVLVGAGDAAISATIDAVVERDTTERPGQAARAAFRTLGVR
ncbi:MAG TPA: folate-binding protein [Acidothermaceae bacterium]|jgi:folate-binding protein YgfZ|nr:folate-binding protein [Acidothermaceae bacterium]